MTCMECENSMLERPRLIANVDGALVGLTGCLLHARMVQELVDRMQVGTR